MSNDQNKTNDEMTLPVKQPATDPIPGAEVVEEVAESDLDNVNGGMRAWCTITKLCGGTQVTGG